MKEDKRFTQKIPKPIERFLLKLWAGNEQLDYGRELVVDMVRNYISTQCNNCLKPIRILDIGAGRGVDLKNIKDQINHNLQLYAVETYKPNFKTLQDVGAEVYNLDIEKNVLPFDDHSIDVIIANQVIEHTKEIFFIFSELSRILKKNGVAIIGFPNLAALHNRVLMLFGEQPLCIRMPGPHVRGITKGAFSQFITTDNYFRIIEIKGANFYPFPPNIAKAFAKILPSFSISLYFLCQRTSLKGEFKDVLNSRRYQTNYYTGE
jgi:SAM-dependent methyltransferase